MLISCLLVSHNKPDYVKNAIESVLSQCASNWELIVMDSGILYDQDFFTSYQAENRIKIYPTKETEMTRKTKAIAPWCFNECFRRGLVKGDLVTYLCDDDVFYPKAFSTFIKWATNNQNIMAMYGSIDTSVYTKEKGSTIYGERKALEIGGKGAYPMDCRVDYLQLCHRKSLLEYFENNEYWPEDKRLEMHADGVFMERIGKICHIYPVLTKIGENRRTPESIYYPYK